MDSDSKILQKKSEISIGFAKMATSWAIFLAIISYGIAVVIFFYGLDGDFSFYPFGSDFNERGFILRILVTLLGISSIILSIVGIVKKEPWKRIIIGLLLGFGCIFIEISIILLVLAFFSGLLSYPAKKC